MTAGGNKFTLVYGSRTYYFDSLVLSFEERIEETPLINGRMYRARAASGRNDMKLKGRLALSQVGDYKTLINAFGSGARNFTLNGEQYTSWALISGRISSEENQQYAVCELILAEVAI